MSEEHEAEYGLVMPFVVCASNGGPYEDGAFVAGARYGFIDALLRSLGEFGIPEVEHYVETGLVPQLDLLAMHRGWMMSAEPWSEHPDEWTLVTFARGTSPGGNGLAHAQDNER